MTRAERAVEDVVAVERMAPGLVRVVTLSDHYVVDAKEGGCECPDAEYNLDDGEYCKHHLAAVLATGAYPAPFPVVDDLWHCRRPSDGTQRLVTDGGQRVDGEWHVHDPERGNVHTFDNEPDALDRVAEAENLGIDVDLYPPGDTPPGHEPAADGGADTGDETGETTEAEVVDMVDAEDDANPEATGAEETRLATTADVNGGPAAAGPLEPVDPEGTVEMYQNYEQLKADLLNASDYQDGEFIKKSGWRKIATAFNVDVDVTDRERELDDGVVRYTVEAVATAPNGKTARALGMAESSESNFMDALDYQSEVRGHEEDVKDDPDVMKVDGKYRRLKDPRAVKEHNVLTLASTRAKNRCISDLVGGGEVSAEEVR